MMVKIYIFIGISEDKMSAASAYDAKVSYSALFGRELGLPINTRNSVLNLTTVPSKEDVKLKELINTNSCLVMIQNYRFDQERLDALLRELHSLERAPVIDFKSLGRNTELWHCFKRIMNYESNGCGPFTRKQIIVGIRLRGQENFQNDPDYVERETRNFDSLVCFKIRMLYRSIWNIEK